MRGETFDARLSPRDQRDPEEPRAHPTPPFFSLIRSEFRTPRPRRASWSLKIGDRDRRRRCRRVKVRRYAAGYRNRSKLTTPRLGKWPRAWNRSQSGNAPITKLLSHGTGSGQTLKQLSSSRREHTRAMENQFETSCHRQ